MPQMKRYLFSVCVLSLLLLFPAARPARADVTGTILGNVTDPSGAAVPGAAVTLSDPTRGFHRETVTDSIGAYEFLAVPVGENYVLEVQVTGFRKSTQTGIKLLVNQKYRADFQLQVGEINQTVEVSSNAVQVESTSNQLGDVIEDKKMTNLPLNGRSYIDLLGLQAGVVPVGSSTAYDDRPVGGTGSAGNVSVNGQREAANSFLVNGGDVQEGRNNGASVVPTLDSIQEFRLLTNSFDAEYGRFSGAIVNALTKSGNNSFHGSAFEFLRNENLDARNFFDPEKGVFRRNQFGGVVGGPIIKNRLFFFSDYQGTRESRGVSIGTVLVPSPTERTGDFSDVDTTGFPALTGIVRGDDVPNNGTFDEALTQRLGYLVKSGEPYWVAGCNTQADALSGMCVFPGQVIPQAAWSPVSQATLQFIPNPIGYQGGQPYFSTASQQQIVRDDKFAQRIDLTTQKAGTFSFYYHFDDSNVQRPYALANVPGFETVTPNRAQQANVSNTLTLGATAVNEARFNFTRTALMLNQPLGGLGPVSSFGYETGGLGINPVNPQLEGVAPIGLYGSYGTAFGLPDGTTGQYNNTFQGSENYTKAKGKHTFKFGADYRYFQINERNAYTSNGYFEFYGNETGNDFADYLIGAPDLFIQSSNQYLDSRTNYFGVYGQDTYKIKPNLTLNYGLRWEVSQPFYDTQGKIQAFVPGQQSTVYPDAPTGWVFPGDAGIPKTLAPTRYDNFGPRVGIAYSPSASDGVWGKIFGGPGKTSIRAAYGIYYTAIEDLTLFIEVGDAPFGLFYVSPTEVYLEEPYADRRRGNNPGQRFPFTIPPPGATGIWPTYQPISSSPGFKTDNVLPYAEHFNFSIEREFRKSIILRMGYVGTVGHHLIAQTSFNPGDQARCLQLRAQLGPDVGCGPNGEDTIYDLNGDGEYTPGVDAFGTRPYSITSGRYATQGLLDFSNNTWETTIANSSYNALQVSVEKRAGDLQLLGAYTLAKSLDNASSFGDTINPYNHRISRSLSSYDIRHNFVVSYVYNMPFQRLSHSSSGALYKLLDGWSFSGITRFTTGFPIGMSASGDRSLCGCSGVDRPNYDGQPIQFLDPRATDNHLYFVTDPFTPEELGVAGNANRRFFHGPGLNQWDISIQKNTRITEGMMIQFRAELFNAFNHAQFYNPGGNVMSGSFGQVGSARDPRIGQFALKFMF
jgi:hypothetical protein